MPSTFGDLGNTEHIISHGLSRNRTHQTKTKWKKKIIKKRKKLPCFSFLPTPELLCSPQLFYYKIKVEILKHIREYTPPQQSCFKNNLNTHTFRHLLAPVSIQADQTPRHKEGCPETERQNTQNTSAPTKRKADTTASHTPTLQVHVTATKKTQFL